MAGTARVLAIDGGGIRGLIPALVLARIERQTGRSVSELFHLVAGTSTGGILACGLARPDPTGPGPALRAADLVSLYRERGREIFDRSLWREVRTLDGLVDERYSADALERVLRDTLGDTWLSEALVDLLVPAYDIEARDARFMKSWRARGELLDPGETASERDFRLRDVAFATSAAPTYFEPARIENRAGRAFALVDGGVFANNPAMCALVSARKLYPKARRFLVVSLGSGQQTRPIPYRDAKHWGLIGWARPLLDVIFDGVADTVDYEAEELLPRSYARFQIELDDVPGAEGGASDALDDVSPENLERLALTADALMRRERAKLDSVCRRLRPALPPRSGLVS